MPIVPQSQVTAQVGNFVWTDLNVNGLMDAGEPGCDGVTVNLYRDVNGNEIPEAGGPDGAPAASTVTAGGGNYAFGDLPAGNYFLEFRPPSGKILAGRNLGTDDTLDSDPDRATGLTEVFPLAVGQTELSWDAGILPIDLSLSKTVTNERPAVGTNVILSIAVRNQAGFSTATSVDVTDVLPFGLSYLSSSASQGSYDSGSGIWTVGSVAGGGHATLDVTARVDTSTTRTSTAEVTRAGEPDTDSTPGNGVVTEDDQGSVSLAPPVHSQLGTLGNLVWEDMNRDGLQTSGEPGVANVTVTLAGGGVDGVLGTADDTTASTATNASGGYSFTELTPGIQYRITFSNLPAGYSFTQAKVGSDDASDSDADPATGMSPIVVLGSDGLNETVDAGISGGVVGQAMIAGTALSQLPGITVSFDLAPVLSPGPFFPGVSHSLSFLPLLSSFPSASAKLFLDFNGAPAQTWGYYNVPQTPPYDQDGDPTTFCDGELTSMQSIWAQVAEAFSPFNIDVTTIDPGNRTDLQTAVVVIGGDGAWTGGVYAGIAHIGGFYNVAPNDVYVFTTNLGNGYAQYTARTVAHEAGHVFGLNHQSLYDAQGNLVNEYSPGDSQRAPLMGSAFTSVRGIWHNGPDPYGPTHYQDDVAMLTDGRNGWGYRADDRGDTQQTGTPLTVNGYALSGNGIIGQLADQDVFLLTTTGGDLNVTASPVLGGPMLDAQLAQYNNSNQLVAIASTSSLRETIAATVPAGSYYLKVASQGQYGDLGQYTISGTLTPPAVLAPPSALTAAPASISMVNLAWQDNSIGEEGFRVERSDNGGASWLTIAASVAGTAYQDIGRTPGATYQYRVRAVHGSTVSDYSNVANLTLVPTEPTNLTATAASATAANLAWLDNSSFEDGYKIQRSTDGGATWTTLAATVAGTTYQDTGRTTGATYHYRAYAVAGAVVSAYSNTASVAMVPQAPSNLTATAASITAVNLAWQDNSPWDSGFKVQRSADGGTTWTTLTSSAITATTYQSTSLTAGTGYTYRVFAVSGTTQSPYSGTAQVSTLPAAPGSPRLTVMSYSQIKITWSNVTGETGFRVERSLTGTSGWTLDGTVPANTLSYNSNNLAPTTKYYYRVLAVNASGSSAASSTVNGTTSAAPVPAAPGNPAAAALSSSQIRVTWSDVAFEASYRIERSPNGSSGWTQVGTVGLDTLEYYDTGLAAATPYYYRVLATNSTGTSPASSVVSAITSMSVPAAHRAFLPRDPGQLERRGGRDLVRRRTLDQRQQLRLDAGGHGGSRHAVVGRHRFDAADHVLLPRLRRSARRHFAGQFKFPCNHDPDSLGGPCRPRQRTVPGHLRQHDPDRLGRRGAGDVVRRPTLADRYRRLDAGGHGGRGYDVVRRHRLDAADDLLLPRVGGERVGRFTARRGRRPHYPHAGTAGPGQSGCDRRVFPRDSAYLERRGLRVFVPRGTLGDGHQRLDDGGHGRRRYLDVQQQRLDAIDQVLLPRDRRQFDGRIAGQRRRQRDHPGDSHGGALGAQQPRRDRAFVHVDQDDVARHHERIVLPRRTLADRHQWLDPGRYGADQHVAVHRHGPGGFDQVLLPRVRGERIGQFGRQFGRVRDHPGTSAGGAQQPAFDVRWPHLGRSGLERQCDQRERVQDRAVHQRDHLDPDRHHVGQRDHVYVQQVDGQHELLLSGPRV